MPKLIKRTPAKPALALSSLKVVDIPDDLLIEHPDNANEQDESTLDALAQKIKDDGFDEPIQVVPSIDQPGKYVIFSGHYRRKAGKLAGLKGPWPCIVREGWDQHKVAMELVSRNNLRGKLNPEKFRRLVEKLQREGYDQALIQAQMGFTKSDAFEKLFKQAMDAAPKAARPKLAEAKENIKSVDGLSSVLNTIFTEHGTDLQYGFLVFDFGKQQHHYVPTDQELHAGLTRLEERCHAENLDIRKIFKLVLRDTNSLDVSWCKREETAPVTSEVVVAPKPKLKAKPRPKAKTP